MPSTNHYPTAVIEEIVFMHDRARDPQVGHFRWIGEGTFGGLIEALSLDSGHLRLPNEALTIADEGTYDG